MVTKELYGKERERSRGQIKTCRKKQHVKIDDMKEMPDLICGKTAVGGNYNSTHDNSDYAKYLMAEKITDFDAKSIEELSKPILTKEEFERKQIEEQQKEICKKAHELWNDTLNNIDGLVYPHKWEYLNYLEEIRYRKASTLTLQQVKEPILSFDEFNEMMERESARPVEAVGNVQDAVVVKEAEEIEETIGIEKNPAENLEVQDISILESTVEEVAVMEPVIERPATMREWTRP